MEKSSRRKYIEEAAKYLPIEDQELINEITREFQRTVDKYATDLNKFALLLIAVQMMDDALKTHLAQFLAENPDLVEPSFELSIPISMN